MDLRELPSPVRVYWDLDPAAGPSPDIRRVCDEILSLKFLFLSLRDVTVPLSAACFEILDRLERAHLSLSLIVPADALDRAAMARFSSFRIKPLLIEAVSLAEVRRAITGVAACGPLGMEWGLSFGVTEENFGDIPALLRICLTEGIRTLSFPIQRLASGGDCFCPTAEIRERLAKEIGAVDYSGIRITIHDPFLWKVFYPDAAYHEGGCQAANSMIFIAAYGRVYPCPAMPLLLGDLHQSMLAEILASSQKHELRKVLLSAASDCTACGQAVACLGGCRGRALAVSGTLQARDPAC